MTSPRCPVKMRFPLPGIVVASTNSTSHPVAKSRMDRIEQVRRGHEQHAGEIEGYAEVMVAEGVVLLRIEHLEQGRGGIAPVIHPQLVHLIQHENRIRGSPLLDPLDDP